MSVKYIYAHSECAVHKSSSRDEDEGAMPPLPCHSSPQVSKTVDVFMVQASNRKIGFYCSTIPCSDLPLQNL